MTLAQNKEGGTSEVEMKECEQVTSGQECLSRTHNFSPNGASECWHFLFDEMVFHLKMVICQNPTIPGSMKVWSRKVY